MHVDCPLIDKVVVAPDAIKQLRAAEHAPGRLHQILEKAKFGWRKLDVPLAARNTLGYAVEADVAEGELVGLLSVVIREGEATIIFMSVYPEYQGTGVGSALLKAAEELVVKRNLQFLRVATTNDDIPLLYWYQRHGFTIYDVRVGEVADKFGSATPGFSGIPVRDEVRMRRSACAR